MELSRFGVDLHESKTAVSEVHVPFEGEGGERAPSFFFAKTHDHIAEILCIGESGGRCPGFRKA